VTVDYATVGVITDRLLKGDAADVTIVTAPQMEELQKQGKISAGSRIEVARVGVGVFVRAGAANPTSARSMASSARCWPQSPSAMAIQRLKASVAFTWQRS